MPPREQIILAQRRVGSVYVRCIDMDERINCSIASGIRSDLEEFVDECHSIFICHISAVKGMEATQGHLTEILQDNQPVNITASLGDNQPRVISTGILGREATALFSSEGKFQELQAMSFVVSIFAHWEHVIRPMLACQLGVNYKKVESNLMGDWRGLRNWLIHRGAKDAEDDYFGKAKELPCLLDSRRGEPRVTTREVLLLMERLRVLTVIVNPKGQEVKPVSEDKESLRQHLLNEHCIHRRAGSGGNANG